MNLKRVHRLVRPVRRARESAEVAPGTASSAPYRRWGAYASAADMAREWLYGTDFYAAHASLSLPSDRDGWSHVTTVGQFEGLSPSPLFDMNYARAALRLGKGDDVFAAWDMAPRSFSPSPLFDARHYMITHRDVRISGLDAYAHWITYGLFEGRHPSASVELDNIPAIADEDKRRHFVKTLSSLDSLLMTYSSRASINVRALRAAYPDLDDVTTAALTGSVPFCTDPQLIFGDLAAAIRQDPRVLARVKR